MAHLGTSVPRLPPELRRAHVYRVPVSAIEREAIARIAAARGIPVAQLLRELALATAPKVRA